MILLDKIQRRKQNINFIKNMIISVFLIISFCFASVSINGNISASRTWDEVGILESRNDIISNSDSYSPDLDEWPFTIGPRAVAFTELYGSNKNLTAYKGEIPYSEKDNESFQKYRVYNSSKINGIKRPWGKSVIGESVDDEKENGGTSSNNNGFLGPDGKNLNKGTSGTTGSEKDGKQVIDKEHDYHLVSMGEYQKNSGISKIIFTVFGFIFSIIKIFLRLLIFIKGVNPTDIFDAVDSGGKLKDAFNALFLVSKDGTMSPFLKVGIIAFLFGMIGTLIKAIKGNASFKVVLNEMGVLLLSAGIAGMCLIGSSQSSIGKFGINIITNFSTQVTASVSDASNLYMYSTGDASKDASHSQYELINKPYVDTLIKMQFGEKVSDLDINKFGNDADANVKKTFGDNKHNFEVSNGVAKYNNLGYYWWAANSRVNPNTPLDGGKIESSNEDMTLFIVDFLENSRISTETKDDSALKLKLDSIMRNMTNISYTSGCWNMLMLIVTYIMLFYALIAATLFLTIGKIIITVGAYLIPIIPALLLFRKTRDFAKSFLNTYLNGFIRFAVGTVIFDLVLTTTIVMFEQGFVGVVVACVLLGFAGKFCPALLRVINQRIQRTDAGFMNSINSGMQRFSGKMQNMKGGFQSVGGDGRMETTGFLNAVKNGFSKSKIDDINDDMLGDKDFNKDVNFDLDEFIANGGNKINTNPGSNALTGDFAADSDDILSPKNNGIDISDTSGRIPTGDGFDSESDGNHENIIKPNHNIDIGDKGEKINGGKTVGIEEFSDDLIVGNEPDAPINVHKSGINNAGLDPFDDNFDRSKTFNANNDVILGSESSSYNSEGVVNLGDIFDAPSSKVENGRKMQESAKLKETLDNANNIRRQNVTELKELKAKRDSLIRRNKSAASVLKDKAVASTRLTDNSERVKKYNKNLDELNKQIKEKVDNISRIDKNTTERINKFNSEFKDK